MAKPVYLVMLDNLPDLSEVPSVTATSVGISHLVTRHPSSLWFQQEAVDLIGLIRLVYLFINQSTWRDMPSGLNIQRSRRKNVEFLFR